jgi:hypothetical protein
MQTMTLEPAGSARQASASAPDGSMGEPELDALRLEVLRALTGPAYRAAHEIPRRQPLLLHAQVRATVRALAEEGLLERVADRRSAGTVPAYRASAAGRSALDRLDS